MIPLVWNGMMSFGGAWFFLAASESITVLNHHYALPGIGSYVAAAIAQGNLSQVGLAIARHDRAWSSGSTSSSGGR